MREQWLIEDRVPGAHIGYRAIVDAEGYTICEPSPMGEANARLIAAAPDLMEALERLLAEVEAIHDRQIYDRDGIRAAMEMARSAISKAVGRKEFLHIDLPAAWASGLINGDWSGLDYSDPAEARKARKWLEESGLDAVSCGDVTILKPYDGVLTECLEYVFVRRKT